MQGLASKWQGRGVETGLVPTMGYLHAGHLSLMAKARKLVGPKGNVVVSIYVNPTQFAPSEDLSRYPRDFRRDVSLCRAAGVDIIFAPGDRHMYPSGTPAPFSTFVGEENFSKGMEGKSRPHHFRGVTTVVAKLFNIVRPSLAVFGAKDYQQAAIVQKMVADLNFPLKIIVAPIVREPDGLALSSRNKYLKGPHRKSALALSQSIETISKIVKKQKRPKASSRLKEKVRALIERHPDIKLDYVEFFDPKTLSPASSVSSGVHMALAVYVGKVRLIDNALL
jgi:pantoate--beta-alanine ligase